MEEQKIYALFAGINKYAGVEEIPPLYGCVRDVERMDALLKDRVASGGAYFPRILRNEEATRERIIELFRTHLGQAGPNDVVLFMFSGHGSQQAAAQEFYSQYPNGLDETLVCYNSRLECGLDLADKELAVLLSEIRAHHVVVILDCCHSGSGTRTSDLLKFDRVRMAGPLRHPRELGTYLNGYYLNQVRMGIGPSIPESSHILLSACTNKQLALEHYSGYGLFSASLLRVLSERGPNISYAELFWRCRKEIFLEAHHQTPQFECYGHTSPHLGFLGSGPSAFGQIPLQQVYRDGGRWMVNVGAMLGIHVSPTDSVDVKLYQGKRFVGRASLKGVGPERSELTLHDSLPEGLGDIEAELLEFLPPPVRLYVDAASWATDALSPEVLGNLHAAYATDRSDADFILQGTPMGLSLVDPYLGRSLRDTTHANRAGVEEMIESLRRVLTWSRFRTLQNTNAERLQAQVDIDFRMSRVDGEAIRCDCIRYELPFGRVGDENVHFYPSLRVRNLGGDRLFFHVFHLSRHYGINRPAWREVDGNSDWIEIWQNTEEEGLGLVATANEGMDTFMVLVGTTELQTWLIEQGGLNERIGAGRDVFRSLPSVARWATFRFDFVLQRKLGGVGVADLRVGDGVLTFGAHPGFRADVYLSASRAVRGDVSPSALVPELLFGKPARCLNLATRKGVEESCVVLRNIDGGDRLATMPLAARLNCALSNGEVLLVLGSDGEQVWRLGDSQGMGRQEVGIRGIPASCSELRMWFFAVQSDQIDPILQFLNIVS